MRIAKKRATPSPCVYFQVHQPYRLIEYDFFCIGDHPGYENDWLNAEMFTKVAEKCYLPATRLLRGLVEESGGRFRFALSMTGTVLEQMEEFGPAVLEAFRGLAATGAVEILGETYHHSLASLYSPAEFRRQVELHREKIRSLFGVEPRVLRNTELIYCNALAEEAERLGYSGVLAESVPWLLRGRSPNYLVRAPNVTTIKTFLRNTGLSDDLAFRFSDRSWKEYPVTPRKFLGWLRRFGGDLVNLFMDFESIGEHQWRDTGIFRFWERFVPLALRQGVRFVTPSEAVEQFEAVHEYDCHAPTSWADQERDLSAWLGNVMQQEAARKLHAIESAVLATEDAGLLRAWSRLQCSDHLYYMSTKGGTDGMVHRYFSPFRSPYHAYIYFMNTLADLQIRLDRGRTSPVAA